MVKIIIFLGFFGLLLQAEDMTNNEETLQNACLSCHKQQQIPSRLIYKRYLMKYSTAERMEDVIFHYLKNPDKKKSIMPPQFFLKFPMKMASTLDDATLHKQIEAYINKFDVKKYLKIKK